MQERLEFEFPKPAPGHSRLVLEASKSEIRHLVKGKLADEPEPIRKAGLKIAESIRCIELGLGEPSYNESLGFKEAIKILERANLKGELPRVLLIAKKAYDTSLDDIEHPPSPLFKALSKSQEPKKKENKQVRDEMFITIPFGTNLDELNNSAQDVLSRNYVLRRQLGDELYSKFTVAVLALLRKGTLSRSQLIAYGLKPQLVRNQARSIVGSLYIKRSGRRRLMR